MKKISALFAFLACVSISACLRGTQEFSISDPENIIASAELRLCRDPVQLTRGEGKLLWAGQIRCEGGGRIAVRFTDGSETECYIGYASYALDQISEYVIEDGQCQWDPASRMKFEKYRAAESAP